MELKESRKVDPFIVYAIAAAEQASAMPAGKPASREDQVATGVLIGSGIGAFGIEEAAIILRERGPLASAVLHSGRSSIRPPARCRSATACARTAPWSRPAPPAPTPSATLRV
jgi:3-oxoacyl-(acyl-carrier-protein) synthase